MLERREDYYMHNGKQVRDKPYFKTIRFRVIQEPDVALLGLKGGEIDEMMLTPQQWRTQTTDDEFYKNNTKAYGTEWVSFHFVWNLPEPVVRRQARPLGDDLCLRPRGDAAEAALRPRSAGQRHVPSRVALGTRRPHRPS